MGQRLNIQIEYENYVSDIQDEAYHQYKDDKLLGLDC